MKCFLQKKNNGAFLIITELKFQKKMKLNDCLFVTGGKIKKTRFTL